MDELQIITQLLETVGDFGLSLVFLWMLIREQSAHEDTRRQYRDDLREVAGMNPHLRPPPRTESDEPP